MINIMLINAIAFIHMLAVMAKKHLANQQTTVIYPIWLIQR